MDPIHNPESRFQGLDPYYVAGAFTEAMSIVPFNHVTEWKLDRFMNIGGFSSNGKSDKDFSKQWYFSDMLRALIIQVKTTVGQLMLKEWCKNDVTVIINTVSWKT